MARRPAVDRKNQLRRDTVASACADEKQAARFRSWHTNAATRLRARAEKRAAQLSLFELKEDRRPASQLSADGRYSEPTLFKTD